MIIEKRNGFFVQLILRKDLMELQSGERESVPLRMITFVSPMDIEATKKALKRNYTREAIARSIANHKHSSMTSCGMFAKRKDAARNKEITLKEYKELTCNETS